MTVRVSLEPSDSCHHLPMGHRWGLVAATLVSVVASIGMAGTRQPEPSVSAGRLASQAQIRTAVDPQTPPASADVEAVDPGVLGLVPDDSTARPVATLGPTPPTDDAAVAAATRRINAQARRPQQVRIAVTGDVLLHLPVVNAATGPTGRDFAPMLAPIAAVVREADLGLCHLEVPLSRDGSALSGYPVFQGPPEIAAALVSTGYAGCSTASNHSMDKGAAGVRSTLDVLDAAGLGHAGTARSLGEDATPTLYRVATSAGRDVVVAHVSATYGLNGFVVPADQPWLVDPIDPVTAITAEASLARAAGAQVIVVSVHWGEEYQVEPSAYQRAVAAELLASPDVDLIVGHHAHVVQPIERVGDKAVIYGLGNLLSGQGGRHTPGTQDGVVVTVTMSVSGAGEVAVTDIGYVPTWVEPTSYRALPVPASLADPSLSPDRRAALEASLDRTVTAIGAGAAQTPWQPGAPGP